MHSRSYTGKEVVREELYELYPVRPEVRYGVMARNTLRIGCPGT